MVTTVEEEVATITMVALATMPTVGLMSTMRVLRHMMQVQAQGLLRPVAALLEAMERLLLRLPPPHQRRGLAGRLANPEMLVALATTVGSK